MLDKFHDECGVFGIFDHPEAANITYLGLYSLQHRGQESAGIVTSTVNGFKSHKGMGLVADVFNVERLASLPGNSGIGHVRYSTSGGSHIKNAQPFSVEYSLGEIAIAHNGNMVNAERIRDELEAYGSIFQSSMDTEVIAHLIATGNESTVLNRLVSALKRVDGSYSMLLLTKDKMIAARDPHGFRPLALGRLRNSYVIASESCAFDLIEGEYIREIEPGEVLVIDNDGLKSYKPFDKVEYKPCIFELIYFARPDSKIFSSSVYDVRKKFGSELATEFPTDADVVIPVPDSGLPAAIGYAETAGIPFEMGLIRNHYVGRTFIEPKDSIRHFGVKVKLNANSEVVKGKRVVVVDDSIVRGTTSRKIIKMIRNAGAKEVHMRISSPPTVSPCFYGIDTPDKGELIAANHSLEEINDYITSDTLGYLSVEGMYRAVKGSGASFCDACFTGKYPVAIHPKRAPQLALFG